MWPTATCATVPNTAPCGALWDACAVASWKCDLIDASEDHTYPPPRGPERADQRVSRRMSCPDAFSDLMSRSPIQASELDLSGALGGIRTPNLLIRSQML